MTSSSSKRGRLTRSSSLDFPTMEDLHGWLKPHIKAEDLMSWGKKPGTRTIHNLWIEHKNGESDLDDSTIPPRRIVNCAVVRILHPTDRTKVLLKSRTELSDGSVRHIGRPLSQKIKAHESVKDAAVRGVKEQLSSYRVWIVGGPYEPKTTEMASDSFPGLPCSYVLHTLDAEGRDLPEGDFSTLEKGEQEEELQNHGCSQVHKAVTVKKHFWKWGDDPDHLGGSIDDFLRYAESAFQVFKSELVKRAAKFAIEEWKGKKCLDRAPVIDDRLCIAILLASSSNSEAVVASGLLHDDSLCDTEPRYHAFENKFGKEVANLVTDVSKLSKLSKIIRKEQKLLNSKNSKRMLDLILAMVGDVRAVMIKIAERTVQMIALDILRKQSLVQETLDVYVPLSERLNFNLWKNQLQNLCFDPSDELKNSYAIISENDEDGIAFKVKLEDALKEEKLAYIRVESRKKSLQSIQNKISMYRDALKDIQVEPCKESLRSIDNKISEYRSSEKETNEMFEDSIIFSEIKDIIGLRIIVKTEEECYKAIDVVKGLWEVELIKNYIKNPKPDGYESLHVIVKNKKDQYMEVQIRTEEMHMKSDDAHWLYKEGDSQVSEYVKELVKFARLVNRKETKVTGVEGNSSPHQPGCSYAKLNKPPCLDATGVCKFPGKEHVYVIVKAKNKVGIKQHLIGTKLEALCQQRGLLKGQLKGRVLVNEVYASPSYILRSGDFIEFIGFSDVLEGKDSNDGEGDHLDGSTGGLLRYAESKFKVFESEELKMGHVVEVDHLRDRRGGYRISANDDFMIRGRENRSGYRSSPLDPLADNGFDHAKNDLDRRSSNNMDDDSYVVSLRSMSLDQAGTDGRNTTIIDSEIPSTVQRPENLSNRVGYEPDALSLMPERGAEKGSVGYDPALDYNMQASLHEKNKEMVAGQGSKKSVRERKSKLVPDNSDRKKTAGPIRKGKPSKLSPLEEARARAERLRTYKADLQRMKKEKEEEQIKRLEALKLERQKRIAARGSSVTSQSALKPTRKQLPIKLSPSSNKGSKFSDSEPGSSSPLQRFPIKAISARSGDPPKASRSSKLSQGSSTAGNRLNRLKNKM